MSKPALATICHDPEGRLLETARRLLPKLSTLFNGMALQASEQTSEGLLESVQMLDGITQRDNEDGGAVRLGKKRRNALDLALSLETSHVLYVDFDRLLHWFETYPEELRQTLKTIPKNDVTLLAWWY